MFRYQNLPKLVPTEEPSRPPVNCRVTQKPRNSNGLYRKTKNPFEPKLCLNKGV